jgi:hypothetical protein
MRIFFPLLNLILLSSCHTKELSKVISFNGVVKTCIIDSTSLTKEETVLIIQQKYYPNNDCSNRPYYASYIAWPANIFIDFKSKYYLFKYSPVPDTINTNFRESKYMTLWHEDFGTLRVRKNVLTLISKKRIWQRSFNIKWSPNKDTLILIAKPNPQE